MWEVKPIMQGLLIGATMSTQRSRSPSAMIKQDFPHLRNGWMI